MSGIALRCPQCGTTQSHIGECDACYEDQVRYFCSNHSPGRWLDAPACGQCGARFGEQTKSRPTPPPPATRPAAPRTARQPEVRRPLPHRSPRTAESPARSRRPPDALVARTEPTLEELLAHLASDRRERTDYREEELPWSEPAPEVRPARARPQWGLFKLMVVALVLLALFMGGPFLLLLFGALQFLL